MVMSFTPLMPLLVLRVRHLALEAIMMRRAWGSQRCSCRRGQQRIGGHEE